LIYFGHTWQADWNSVNSHKEGVFMLYVVGEKLARWDIRENTKNFLRVKTSAAAPAIIKIKPTYKCNLAKTKYGKPREWKGKVVDIII
jgi:hypothetical protein